MSIRRLTLGPDPERLCVRLYVKQIGDCRASMFVAEDEARIGPRGMGVRAKVPSSCRGASPSWQCCSEDGLAVVHGGAGRALSHSHHSALEEGH
jgi:hypothetical protein